jgi:hypothetical protein
VRRPRSVRSVPGQAAIRAHSHADERSPDHGCRSVCPVTTDVWDFYGQYAESDRSALGERERQVLAICDLRQEVNSGGFDSYFRYWGGDTAPTAAAALPQLLGSAWADVLREAVALLGDPYPASADDRADKIDRHSLDDALNGLDQRFYALEASTEADTRLSEVINADQG